MSTIAAGTNSLDFMISQGANQGIFSRLVFARLAATTAAIAPNGGGVSVSRFPITFAFPTLGGSVTGGYIPSVHMVTEDTTTGLIAAIEVSFGSLNCATNAWTAGSSMPTRTVAGTSTVLASCIPVAVVTTALTGATSKTLNLSSYTDQDGNTGAALANALALPNNPAVNSAFFLSPNLASGDTGIRAIATAALNTTVTAGVITIYGLIPIAANVVSSAAAEMVVSINSMLASWPKILAVAGDVMAFYRYSQNALCDFVAVVSAVGDN